MTLMKMEKSESLSTELRLMHQFPTDAHIIERMQVAERQTAFCRIAAMRRVEYTEFRRVSNQPNAFLGLISQEQFKTVLSDACVQIDFNAQNAFNAHIAFNSINA